MADPRNDRARQKFLQSENVRQFARQHAAGSIFLVDRFGQPVNKGDKVLWHPPYDYVYDIVDLRPVLDPRAPVGQLAVTVICRATLMLPANTAIMQMMKIHFADGDAGEQPPAGTETPETPASDAPDHHAGEALVEPPPETSRVKLTDPE